MKNNVTAFLFSSASVLALSLVGCGGGSSSPTPAGVPAPTPVPPPAPTTLTLSGTAATGAPLSGATIRVIDKTGASKTATAPADNDGRFTLDVTGLVAPLLVIAEGRVGDSIGRYYAIDPVGAASGTLTVNVTPLTTAVAALSSPSLNPAALESAAALATVSATQVADAVKAINTALAPTYAAAGIADPASFDPMKTPFTVGTPGQDRLLDAVKVTLGTTGVTFTNATVPIVGDAAPAGALITLSPANLASPPVIASGGATAITVGFLTSLRDGLNNCFKVPRAERATSPTCTALFTSDYLMHGRNAAQRWLGDFAGLDNAAFAIPELLFTSTVSDGTVRPAIRLVWTGSDGDFATRADVLRNEGTDAAPIWKLVGNQRDIELFVEPRLARIVHRNPAAGASHYQLGIRAIVSIRGPQGDAIAGARVKGPGLPAAGLVLARSMACGIDETLVIANDGGSVSVTAPFTANSSNNYRIAYANLDESKPFTWPGASRNFSELPMTAAELEAIRPGALYRWEVWFRDPATKVIETTPRLYASRLSSELTPPSAGATMPWNAVDEATLAALLDPAAAAAPEATINFTRAAGAEPVRSLYFYGEKLDPLFSPPAFTITSSPLYNALLRVSADNIVAPGAKSATVKVAAQQRGVDFDIGTALPPCSVLEVPSIADPSGYREIGLDSTLPNGVRKRSAYAYVK